MAVYFVTGSLGAGKTLASVTKIDEYLRGGRKVATNLNLNLEHLCSANNAHTRVMRVPDAPTLTEIRAIGLGSDVSDGSRNGLLVLDELGTWFNSRDFANKDRLGVIKYILHLRKRRWDVIFIVQDFSMVDKQLRGNVTQFLVTCQSSKDHFLLKPFPKFQLATVRLRSKIKVETWIYRAKYLYPAYDTEQIFFTDPDEVDDGHDIDLEMGQMEREYKRLNGLYSLLPPAYLGEGIQYEINARTKGDYRSRVSLLTLFALLVVNYVLYDPFQKPIEAYEPNVLSSVETIETIFYKDPVAAEASLFESAYIKKSVRFGSDYSATLGFAYGTEYSTDFLEDLGYLFRPNVGYVNVISPDGHIYQVK
jgi:hypothetical protein